MNTKPAILTSLLFSLLLSGCQQQQANTTEATTEESEQLQQRLYIETTSSNRLEPSQIELAAIVQSEINSNPISAASGSQAGGVNSQAQSQQVAVSQAQIQQIISDLDAQQTSEGLQINLPESILFDFDRYDLRADAQPTLEKVSKLIDYYQNAPVDIAGHTDSKGSDAYNQQLSEQRADAVKNALITQFDIDRSRLNAQGFGESQPIAANTKSDGSDDPTGRQKNRRVEVVVKNQ
ncbi:MAG: OmpA family protein [Pleurocapsa sp. MO_226.B13]|nr:OmpA family protein [Pleurocapsa sp. MO_226.B13]